MFEGVEYFAWLYEDGQCVAYCTRLRGCQYHNVHANGHWQKNTHKWLTNRCITHYSVWNIDGQLLHHGRRTTIENYCVEPSTYKRIGFTALSGWPPTCCDHCRFYDVAGAGVDKGIEVTFQWKFALLRLKHVLRRRARGRLARIVIGMCCLYNDVAALVAAYVV